MHEPFASDIVLLKKFNCLVGSVARSVSIPEKWEEEERRIRLRREKKTG